jgi:hypothetical protein
MSAFRLLSFILYPAAVLRNRISSVYITSICSFFHIRNWASYRPVGMTVTVQFRQDLFLSFEQYARLLASLVMICNLTSVDEDEMSISHNKY